MLVLIAILIALGGGPIMSPSDTGSGVPDHLAPIGATPVSGDTGSGVPDHR
jgi:hypothetical protein